MNVPTRAIPVQDIGFAMATLLMASGALQALTRPDKRETSVLAALCVQAAEKLDMKDQE